MTTAARTLYRNAKIFTADGPAMAEAMLVDGDRLAYVGEESTALRLAGAAAQVDLGGAFVLPGFIDAHTHLLMMGQAMQKVELRDAASLAQIQERLREAANAAPDAARILGRGWLFPAIPGGMPTAAMIDVVIPDRPVYLDSNDVHSMWVNSAALAEMGIDRDTPDPIGGKIQRDPATGEATGLLYETAAQQYAWPTLASVTTDAERDAQLAGAFGHYLSTGVTGGIDMAMGEDDLAAMRRALTASSGGPDGGGTLPLRVTGHWLITQTGSVAGNLAQVARAVELSREVNSPWLRIAGIKIIVDGVIDSCTAAMKEPYADGSNAGLIWELEDLTPVVAAADAAGLQIAMHAIGDAASDAALDALEHACLVNGERDRRHRIEHLETVTPENVQRLARLGVVASMQPVHSDPAIQDNWRAMLGDHRVDRAYPWTEFTDAGATLALGSDAPTAPHQPLPNMYVATTRKSALDQSLPANLPQYALGLAEALGHATRDAAFSCGMEQELGRLATGMLADFVVLDTDPFDAGLDSLLTASVALTVVGGQVRYRG
ncbi:amidohydrolase [Arthrobacter cavernae]|uniref:amidohydrolase n=1 Tax=Arthrobacter cavernae TaxID=2817681 RepID=UPI0027DE830D|nr:amidohydrolase [Arthrobacter cavernae]